MNYTNEELADVHFTYGRANGNSNLARRLYAETYRNRRCPAKGTFAAIHRRLRERGSFIPDTADCGVQRNIRTPDFEEEVLNRIAENSGNSTRRLCEELGASHMTVWRILHEQQLYPYHIQRVQALTEADFRPRMLFCQWFRQQCNNPNFHSYVLFTDEATFARDSIMNFHNDHQWAEENPHAIRNSRHQQTFSCNVWAGIVGEYLIGPMFLPARLNGQNYRRFLEEDLPLLLEDVPLEIRRNLWFMHDGAPAHFSLLAREFLDNNYPNHWIGRRGPISWPARSPDCNPLDFFLWGYLKCLVYSTPIPTVEVLRERIIHSFRVIQNTPGILEHVRQSMMRRCEACIVAQGGHFEHLI